MGITVSVVVVSEELVLLPVSTGIDEGVAVGADVGIIVSVAVVDVPVGASVGISVGGSVVTHLESTQTYTSSVEQHMLTAAPMSSTSQISPGGTHLISVPVGLGVLETRGASFGSMQ